VTEIMAKFVPELMDEVMEKAIMKGLIGLVDTDMAGVSDNLHLYWTAASTAYEDGQPIAPNEIEVVVVPLDRIGAPLGASGASVFVAYFAHDASENARAPSAPLVVKVGNPKGLHEEYNAWKSWPRMGDRNSECFAFPICILDISDEHSLLVASFKSEFEMERNGRRNKVLLRDLWKVLNEKRELDDSEDDQHSNIEKIVEGALSALNEAHLNSFVKFQEDDLNYVESYKWYLRGTTEKGHRAHIPRLLFGSAVTVSAFGKQWPNPIHTIEKILKLPVTKGAFGAVHGDLHPKNIVLSANGRVRIIDFGWARSRQHIIVDHLLLDINLRATTLPSQLSIEDVLALSNFLDPNDNAGDLPKSVQARAGIIQRQIWATAEEKIITDWTMEYLIPLLLVAYGLIVYLDDARNQPAFIATVLALALKVETALEEL